MTDLIAWLTAPIMLLLRMFGLLASALFAIGAARALDEGAAGTFILFACISAFLLYQIGII